LRNTKQLKAQPLKKGFHSLEWDSMIIDPSKYGYEQLTSFTAFQVSEGKATALYFLTHSI
jgi:hypothetical protein